jgi:hypothetical protein
VPLESKSAVWADFAPTNVPWAWQSFFRHTRNIEPYVLRLVDGPLDAQFWLRNRDSGSAFKPRLRAADYWDVADIPLQARLLRKIVA